MPLRRRSTEIATDTYKTMYMTPHNEGSLVMLVTEPVCLHRIKIGYETAYCLPAAAESVLNTEEHFSTALLRIVSVIRSQSRYDERLRERFTVCAPGPRSTRVFVCSSDHVTFAVVKLLGSKHPGLSSQQLVDLFMSRPITYAIFPYGLHKTLNVSFSGLLETGKVAIEETVSPDADMGRLTSSVIFRCSQWSSEPDLSIEYVDESRTNFMQYLPWEDFTMTPVHTAITMGKAVESRLKSIGEALPGLIASKEDVQEFVRRFIHC